MVFPGGIDLIPGQLILAANHNQGKLKVRRDIPDPLLVLALVFFVLLT